MSQVCINPESAEQVSALMGYFSRLDGRIFGLAGVVHMQDALRQMGLKQDQCSGHEWSNRGTPGDLWRECWLCGWQEDV